MSILRLTPQAQQDIDDIYDYIGRRDRRPATADLVVSELTQECQEYADIFARGSIIGTARHDLGESYRVFTHKRWVVVFRSIPDGIEVMRVLDGSRDFTRLFQS
jgi:toxin ParE1/3/4